MLYTYISHSRVPKTYHGVTFYYGDKKEVTGTINDRRFVFCSSRQTPIVENEDEPSDSSNNQSNPSMDSSPAEKPKSTRGRKPKVTESVFEEPTSDDAQ